MIIKLMTYTKPISFVLSDSLPQSSAFNNDDNNDNDDNNNGNDDKEDHDYKADHND